MTAVFRIGICKLANSSPSPKLLPNTPDLRIFVRGIAGKDLRNALPKVKKPEPYNYKEKKYTFFHSLFDKTTRRFDQNTKLIVVEGPVAAGKTKFAKALADDLGMFYFPEANLDMLYTNDYGYNLKQLDPQLPEACRSYDIKDFLMNPKHRLVATMQLRTYIAKYSQYIDALAHVLSTGQGVVLDRCVYSDFVFVEAMYRYGYLSKAAYSIYYDLRKNTLNELLRPHLVLYLHVPVEKVLANIQKRNYNCETKSRVLDSAYLQTIEDNYKQNYLKEISKHAELLVYDWTEEGDVDVIIEDIERLDFGSYDSQDTKMVDWVHHLEEEWGVLRYTYSDNKDYLLMNTNIPRFDAPELVLDAEDARAYRDIVYNIPGMRFDPGFNKECGDSVLFKVLAPHRHTLPLIERDISK